MTTKLDILLTEQNLPPFQVGFERYTLKMSLIYGRGLTTEVLHKLLQNLIPGSIFDVRPDVVYSSYPVGLF